VRQSVRQTDRQTETEIEPFVRSTDRGLV